MNRTFLIALTAILCLAFASSAIADKVLENQNLGGTPPVYLGSEDNRMEYEYEDTDDYVVIGTGDKNAIYMVPSVFQGDKYCHAWLGGPDAVVDVEFAIGRPGFKLLGLTYDPNKIAQGSLLFKEDDSFGPKTIPDLTVNGVTNIGGGFTGSADLYIPVGSMTCYDDVKVGIGTDAEGRVHVQGGSLSLVYTDTPITMTLGDTEDAGADEPPIGNGYLNISGGSFSAPSGTSLTVGNLGYGKLTVIGQTITTIDIDTLDVTDLGEVGFILDGPGTPDVKKISSAGHCYLEDGSIIDMDFASPAVEDSLSALGEADAGRIIDLFDSATMKWNETGYNVALSAEDEPGWDLQKTGDILQAKYLGGTGSDLTVNTGTEGSPTAITTDTYRNVYIGYGPSSVEAGHASINATVGCSSELVIGYGNSCEGSLNIGSGGALSVFSGNVTMGVGSGADATLTLEDDADLYVMYELRLGDTSASPALVGGSAELNVSDTSTLQAEYMMVGDPDNPGKACTVNQSGGEITLREDLLIGANADTGAEGSTYNISGGTLDVTGAINVGADIHASASTGSTLHIDGSDGVILAEDFSLATFCTLKVTLDDGPDYTGGATPIDLTNHGGLDAAMGGSLNESVALFHAVYIGDVVDPNNSCVLEFAFEPGTESLIACQTLELNTDLQPDPGRERGIDIVIMDHEDGLKWQKEDRNEKFETHYYGISMSDSNWVLSEIGSDNNRDGEGYGYIRAYYIATGPTPQPTADAGVNQTVAVDEKAVTLNASGSSVTVGRVMANYEWTWDVGTDTYIISGPEPLAEAYFPVGTHTVTLTVTSDIGETDTDTCMVTVSSTRGAGDVNLDGLTNLSDFVLLRNHFGDSDSDI